MHLRGNSRQTEIRSFSFPELLRIAAYNIWANVVK